MTLRCKWPAGIYLCPVCQEHSHRLTRLRSLFGNSIVKCGDEVLSRDVVTLLQAIHCS